MSRPIDVMIVGAQKAGTTSLLRYLGEHPECISHPQKEFAYFLDTTKYNNNYQNAFEKYYSDLPVTDATLIIAKSASLYSDLKAIKLLYEHNPKCEIIFILRNPIDRTYSSFLMEKNAGSVDFEFNEIKNIIQQTNRWEYEIFINFGIYVSHLKNILSYFPPQQVKILFYEDLKSDAKKLCKNIFTHLKINNSFAPNIEVKHNITKRSRSNIYAKTVTKLLHKNSPLRKLISPIIPSHKAYKYGNILREANKTKDTYPSMDLTTKKTLSDFFEPFNNQLSELIKTDLSAWNYKSQEETDSKSINPSIRYEFKNISHCNMCGQSSLKHVVMGKRLNQSQGKDPKSKTGITTSIIKCSNCSLIYSNPQPIPCDIQDHYGVPPEDYWIPDYFKVTDSYFIAELATLKKLLPQERWNRALDIGAGLGKTMISLNNAGFETYGLEPSKSFYDRAIDIMKIDPDHLSLGMIEDIEYPENHFDFISFGAVLEHLYSPTDSIQKAVKWLKPGGIIHIEVPSSNWLVNKIANTYYRRIKFSDYVANLSPMHQPYHLYEFGLSSFKENSKLNNYHIAHHDYYVCQTYMPKFMDYILKPIMSKTDGGMQLCVWLRKN